MAKAFIDKGLEKVWVTISALYLGGQSVIDAIVKLKGA